MPTISAVIKYATNIDELRAELKAGTDQLVVLEKAAERTTRNLGGEGLIRAAHNAAAAVQELGGASKLTASEQDKVNSLMERAIAKYAALGQTAPTALQQVADATKRVEEPTNRLNGFLGDLSKQIIGTAAGFVSATAVIEGIKTAFHALTEFVSDSVQSYAKQEAAVRKMTAALQAQGQATPAVIEQYKQMAAQFQRTTVFSDDLINEMQALLVEVGNVMPRDMEKALQASTNLASGLGVDLRTATLLVGKAFEGETGTLKRYGIVIDEAKLKAEGITAVLDAVQQKFGGQAQSEIDTYSGKIKQLTNTWDDFKETIGGAIVLNPTVEHVLNLIRDISDRAASQKQSTLSEILGIAGFGSMSESVDILDAYSKKANEARDNTKKFNDFIENNVKKTLSGGNVWNDLIPPREVMLGIAGLTPLTKEQTKAIDEARAAAEQHAKAIRELAATYSGMKAIQGANDALEAVNRNLREGHTIAEMSEEQQIALNKAVTAGIEVYQREGRAVPPELEKIQRATQGIIDVQEDAKIALDDWGEEIRRHNEEYKRGEQETVDALEAIDKERIDNAKAQLDDYAAFVKQHQEDQKNGEEETLKALEDAAQKAKKHRDEMIHGWDALGSAVARVGAAFDNLFGRILTGTGQAIKGVSDLKAATGALNKVAAGIDFGFSFMQSAIAFLERDTLTSKFIKGVTDAYGGVKEFRRQAALAGVSVDRLFSTTSLTTFKRELSIVEAAIKRYQEIQGQISAKQNELLQAQQTVLEKTTSVLEKYGLTWRDAGREFQDAHLDEDANQLYEDMQLLQRAGVDNGVIFGRMKDKIDAYLADATKYASSVTDGFGKVIQSMIATGNFTDADYKKLKDYADAAALAGTEIPESWKPIIQKLIDMGYYTDVNNDGIIDLKDTGIIFSQTTTAGFQSVVDKLDEIVQALKDLEEQLHHVEVQAGRTRGALEQVGTAIPRPVPGQEAPPSSGGEPPADSGGTAVPRPAATGGYVTAYGVQRFRGGGIANAEHFGRGSSLVRFMPQGTDVVPAMLTPGEGVLNVNAMNLLGRVNLDALNAGRLSTLANVQRGPVQGVVILHMDKREVARGIVDVFPGETHRLGVRVVSS